MEIPKFYGITCSFTISLVAFVYVKLLTFFMAKCKKCNKIMAMGEWVVQWEEWVDMEEDMGDKVVEDIQDKVGLAEWEVNSKIVTEIMRWATLVEIQEVDQW